MEDTDSQPIKVDFITFSDLVKEITGTSFDEIFDTVFNGVNYEKGDMVGSSQCDSERIEKEIQN